MLNTNKKVPGGRGTHLNASGIMVEAVNAILIVIVLAAAEKAHRFTVVRGEIVPDICARRIIDRRSPAQGG